MLTPALGRGATACNTFALIAALLGCDGSGDLPAAPSQPAPAVTSIGPSTGPVGGGTAVTILGIGFQNGATVTFGGIPATDVYVTGGTMMVAVAPAHAAGEVDVVVANPDGRSTSLTRSYKYDPNLPDLPADPGPPDDPPCYTDCSPWDY